MQVISKNSREEIHIHRDPFKGHDLMHIRIWTTNADNELIPTRKGVSIQMALVAHLIDALSDEYDEGITHA